MFLEVLEEALADVQTRNGGQSRDRQYGGDQIIDNGTVYTETLCGNKQ